MWHWWRWHGDGDKCKSSSSLLQKQEEEKKIMKTLAQVLCDLCNMHFIFVTWFYVCTLYTLYNAHYCTICWTYECVNKLLYKHYCDTYRWIWQIITHVMWCGLSRLVNREKKAHTQKIILRRHKENKIDGIIKSRSAWNVICFFILCCGWGLFFFISAVVYLYKALSGPSNWPNPKCFGLS